MGCASSTAESPLKAALEAKSMPALLEAVEREGIDAKVMIEYQSNPFIVQCARYDFVAGVIQLVNDGADVNANGHLAVTALHHARSAAVVETLVAAGADIEARDCWRFETPLITASTHGHAEVVAALLASGAAYDYEDNAGFPALWYASVNGHDVVVQLLLAAGAKVDVKDKSDEWTALIKAAEAGHRRVVLHLVAAGADTSAEKWKKTADVIAAEKGYPEIAVIIRAGAEAARATLDAEAGAAGALVIEPEHDVVVKVEDAL